MWVVFDIFLHLCMVRPQGTCQVFEARLLSFFASLHGWCPNLIAWCPIGTSAFFVHTHANSPCGAHGCVCPEETAYLDLMRYTLLYGTATDGLNMYLEERMLYGWECASDYVPSEKWVVLHPTCFQKAMVWPTFPHLNFSITTIRSLFYGIAGIKYRLTYCSWAVTGYNQGGQLYNTWGMKAWGCYKLTTKVISGNTEGAMG